MAGKATLTSLTLEKSLIMLRRAGEMLDHKNIKYCLDGGTLLGIVREQRLLPWDNDMDLTVFWPDRFKIMLWASFLRIYGYHVTFRRHIEDMPPFRKGDIRLIVVRTRKNMVQIGDVHLDIFIKKKSNNDYYWVVGRAERRLKSVPEKFYDQLDRIKFNDHNYSIPKNWDAYLTYRYSDWKKQVKEYNYLEDDLSIISKSENKP